MIFDKHIIATERVIYVFVTNIMTYKPNYPPTQPAMKNSGYVSTAIPGFPIIGHRLLLASF